MKKLSFLVSITLLFTLVLPVVGQAATVGTPSFEINAQGVYLYNMDTETLIYEKNADQRMYPASLTKIMTCILALENTADLDKEILTYPRYVQDYLYDYQYIQGHGEVSKGGLMAGDQLPMREMLYCLMLPSANEAAMIIADHLVDSPQDTAQKDFAQMMNDRARELGATNTNFVNPNGLFDENHYTTPRDMALITQHAMSLDHFMDIVSTTSHSYRPLNSDGPALTWETTNLMMVEGSYYDPAVRGIKTGTLEESGRCFISSSTRDGFTYLLVLMNAPYLDDDGKRIPERLDFADAKNLYKWAFETYKRKSILPKAQPIKEVPLKLSTERDFLQLMTADSVTALVPADLDLNMIEKKFDVPDVVYAPVNKNDPIGWVTLSLAGEELGRVELLAAEKVSASTLLVILEQIKSVLKSFWFKFALIFIVLFIIAYAILAVVRNRNRRRHSGYKPRRRL